MTARTYRQQMAKGRFCSFSLQHNETDLWVGVDPGSFHPAMGESLYNHIGRIRCSLDAYIKENPVFLASFAPVRPPKQAPPFIRRMCLAANSAGVGPMAAVAGCIAQEAGFYLRRQFSVKEVIIENGGDIFMWLQRPVLVSVFSGNNLSETFALEVNHLNRGIGICTSSATIGHSLSLGKADAFVIASGCAYRADALATYYCNRVQSPQDLKPLVGDACRREDVLAALAALDQQVALAGLFKLKIVSGGVC